MPLKNMHSHTPGAVPNLVPGQAAVNLADGVLWLRAAGTKVAIDLAAWKVRAVPGEGIDGAPLARTAAGVAFDAALAPSSTVEGVVAVDPPGWGVPGLALGSIGTPLTLGANGIAYEPFYVASDTVNVADIAFNAVTTPTDAVRVGICATDGTILAETLVDVPILGANTIALSATLPRGAYAVMLWTGADLELVQGLGYLAEQGWQNTLDGAPLFVTRQAPDSADLRAGLVQPSALTDVTSPSPGRNFSLLLRWT